MQQNYNIDPKNYVNIIYKEEYGSKGLNFFEFLLLMMMACTVFLRIIFRDERFGKSIAKLIDSSEITVRFK